MPRTQDPIDQVIALLRARGRDSGFESYNKVNADEGVRYISVIPASDLPTVGTLNDLVVTIRQIVDRVDAVDGLSFRHDRVNLYYGRVIVRETIVIVVYPRKWLADQALFGYGAPVLQCSLASLEGELQTV